jgi:uncharacterized protein YwqG
MNKLSKEEYNEIYNEIYKNILDSPLGKTYETNPNNNNNNKIQSGNDGKIWEINNKDGINIWKPKIVSSLTLNNYIKENLDNITKTVYYPFVIKINSDETGLEQKFGGKPFFTKNDTWPKEDDVYLTFLCQIYDPVDSKKKILYQLFLNNDSMEIYSKIIDMTKKIKDEQIIIEQPKNIKYHHPYKIIKWTKSKELILLPKLLKEMGYPDDCTLFDEDYNTHKYSPDPGIKIGGTPLSCQDQNYYEDFNFLQLSYTDFLKENWGDSGIMHFERNGNFEFDCF